MQFCENNFKHAGMDQLVEDCRTEFKNVNISIEPCLGQCSDCAKMYIARVNDNLITSDTTHYLFDKISDLLG